MRHLVRVAAGSEVWAVVKADGYGHGAIECAGAALAAGAARVCCATLEEARALREALGPGVPLVVMSPIEPGEEAGAGGFEIVVSSLEDYARLRACGVACGVHVKADTGMGRWGLAPADALAVGRELAQGEQPLRLAALMSHLATADDDPAFAAEQTEVFADLDRRFPPCRTAPRQLGRGARAPRDALRRRALRHRALRGLALRRRAGGARPAARAALDEPRRRLARPRARASLRATAGG